MEELLDDTALLPEPIPDRREAPSLRIQDVPDHELPRKTFLTEDVEVVLAKGTGRATAQAGMGVDVLGRRNEQLLIGFLGGKTSVHYTATTIMHDIVSYRHEVARHAEQRRQWQERKAASMARAAEAAKSAAQKQIDDEFMRGCLDAGWVTSIHQDYGHNFYVTLPSDKYTTKDNIRSIAEWLARGYVLQNVEKGGTNRAGVVHVFRGDKVVGRGLYSL